MAKSTDTISWSTHSQTGTEGSAISLGTITGRWSSLTISGIPDGAVLTDGAGHTFTGEFGIASVDVTGWDLTSLAITPASDSNFKLTARTGGGKSTSDAITVHPLAPTVDWASSVSGVEGQAIALNPLTVVVNSLPGDGSGNTLKSLVLSGIPVGVTVTDEAGHSFTATKAKKSVDITSWSWSSLSITSQKDANFTLTVKATERDADGNISTTTVTETVVINPLAPTVTWGPAPSAGAEGAPIALGAIAVTVNKLAGDGWGNTLQSVVINAVPAGATLMDGNGHSFVATPGATSVDVTGWSLSSLSVTPANSANFALQVVATERDAEGNVNSASATEFVTVTPLAPTIVAAPVAGQAGTTIALGIAASVGGLAGDANALQSVVIAEIPNGAVIADGNGHSFIATAATTSVNVAGWSIETLTITLASAATFALSITATEVDVDGNTSITTVSQQVTTDAAVDHAPTVEAGAPSAIVVEAGVGPDNMPVSGTDVAAVQITKGDLDTSATYDTTGWTSNGDGTFSKDGIYGTAVLDTNADTLTYHLNNDTAPANALAAG